MDKQKLLDALEKQAEITYIAETQFIEAYKAKDDAEATYKDFSALLRGEAGDKERHPELRNDRARDGWVAEHLMSGPGGELRTKLAQAATRKLAAQALYNREYQYGQNLRAMALLLSK